MTNSLFNSLIPINIYCTLILDVLKKLLQTTTVNSKEAFINYSRGDYKTGKIFLTFRDPPSQGGIKFSDPPY